MTLPLVSICIPTHNRVADLATRLDELLGQSLSGIEVVVVDDASTDGTDRHVTERARRDPRLRYVGVRPGVGHPRIMWRCFEEARSELVAICHDHDSYQPDAIERLATALRATPAAPFAFCAVRTIDPQTGELQASSADERTAPRYDVVRHFCATGHSLVAASAVMVRRERLPSEPPVPELGLFADVDLWCRMAGEGPVAFVGDALVDVVGWSPQEGLTKLNWAQLGRLARLRRHYLTELRPRGGGATLMAQAEIGLQTLEARARWTAKVLLAAWRREDVPAAALRDTPRTIRLVVRLVSSVAPPGAAR